MRCVVTSILGNLFSAIRSLALASGALAVCGTAAVAQQGGPPQTAGRTIDCSKASLQAAIDKAESGETILFTGTCAESIVIALDGLTLDGDANADNNVDGTILGDATVLGAQRVTLRNLNVDDATGSGNGFDIGIQAIDGAVATLNNVVVNVAAEFVIGINASRNSMITVSDSTVFAQTTGAGGTCDSVAVTANQNSLVVSDGDNVFQNNVDAGVCATNDSYYRQNSNTFDVIEAPRPVVAFDSALADIRGAQINASTGAGDLRVGGSSMLRIRNSNLNFSSITLTTLSACRLRVTTGNVGVINVSGGSFCQAP